MERSISSPHPPLFLNSPRSASPVNKSAVGFQDVRLSFDTQRIRRAKSLESIELILLNASFTEEMSFQPTVPVRLKPINPEIHQGDTLANRIGRMDFRKTQALMLFSISAMGLMIGLLISFIL